MATSTRRRHRADRELKKSEDHERMELIGADRDEFLDTVMNPPQPTERLVAALRRHRDVLG